MIAVKIFFNKLDNKEKKTGVDRGRAQHLEEDCPAGVLELLVSPPLPPPSAMDYVG